MLTGSDPIGAGGGHSSRSSEVDVLGLNCAFGPTELTEIGAVHRRELAAVGQRAAQRGAADDGGRQERSSR